MTTVGCPLCGGPVTLNGERPACEVGHSFPPDKLPLELGERASRALWAAIRALADEAAAVRWRATQRSHDREVLLRDAREIDDQVELLRALVPNAAERRARRPQG